MEMSNVPPKKARGWFFAAFDTYSYAPTGVVCGQYKQDSCVAACCRMLLADQGLDWPESDLRAALKVDGGAFLSAMPQVLGRCGLPVTYQYRRDLTIDELKRAVQNGSATAFVFRPKEQAGHALLVDKVNEDWVCIRDPLPETKGRAYRVALADFLQRWLDSTNCGRAVIVME